jgi:hypothetical protein
LPSIFASNQFGSETFAATKPAELCVPAYLNPVCGNGIIDPGEQCDGGPCCTATCTYLPDSPCLATWTGVRTNVPIASLEGWTECFEGEYRGAGSDIPSVLATCNQSNLLIGCKNRDSDDLLVAAHAPRTDVLFDTGTSNVPHDANGVGWYFNDDWSWGFAPQGDAINRDNCDRVATSYQSGPDADLRMCWRTAAHALDTGFRCGAQQDLYDSYEWHRVIYEAP